MKVITWDGSLAVGIPTIDRQHEELISRLNAIAAAIAQHEGEREIQRTLAFLIDYTKQHFGEEETIMAGAKYPDLVNHRAKHREFIDILNRLEEEYREEGSTKVLAESLHTLLGNWLVGHIARVDVQFAQFSRAPRG
jgi:hemerythrin-like metal-binding protein